MKSTLLFFDIFNNDSCFLITILFLTDGVWIEETEKRYCPNHILPMNNGDVANQIECQEACYQRVDCVGISYSHKTGSTGWCYRCLDDVLEYADNGFGFYRKPGNYDLKYELLISICQKGLNESSNQCLFLFDDCRTYNNNYYHDNTDDNYNSQYY